MNKSIYTLIGIAASGKSTYCDKLIRDKFPSSGAYSFWNKGEEPYAYFNADDIRAELYGDPTIQGDPMKVFGILFDRYTAALRDNDTDLIVIDNTSLTPKMRKRYWKLADTICPMFGHTFDYNLVYFVPDLKRSLLWNSKRDRHVPEDVIRAQFERILPPNESEELRSNIIIIDHNEGKYGSSS